MINEYTPGQTHGGSMQCPFSHNAAEAEPLVNLKWQYQWFWYVGPLSLLPSYELIPQSIVGPSIIVKLVDWINKNLFVLIHHSHTLSENIPSEKIHWLTHTHTHTQSHKNSCIWWKCHSHLGKLCCYVIIQSLRRISLSPPIKLQCLGKWRNISE